MMDADMKIIWIFLQESLMIQRLKKLIVVIPFQNGKFRQFPKHLVKHLMLLEENLNLSLIEIVLIN